MNKEKAHHLLELHRNGKLLILPNIWNPIGARMLEKIGYPAVATTSAAISASLGFRDGERIRIETYLDILERITHSVDLPVTADIESGYGETSQSLEQSMEQFIKTGIVGVNIEDSMKDEEGLRSISEQCQRIEIVREVSKRLGLHLVINARIDSFMIGNIDAKDRLDDAVQRALAYIRAGADCVYPIGPGDVETVTELRRRIPSPLNILATKEATPLHELERLRVNRVSFGPFIFRSCYHKFKQISENLFEKKSYGCFGDGMLTAAEMYPFLREERETES